MRKKTMKSILAGALALALVLTSVPMEAKAANTNVIRNATLTASTVEENAATLAAGKAGDGDTTTRWSGVSLTSQAQAQTEWLKATFANVTTIKQVKVTFHTRNINPSPNNVSSFSIKYTDANGELKVVKENCTVPASGDGYATEVSIVLPDAIQAKELQLCDFVVKIGTTQWNSVGIVEFEAYSEELEAGAPTLESVVASVEALSGSVVSNYISDSADLLNPEAPEGYTITPMGSDLEEVIIIEESMAVWCPPLEDKEVNVFYEVTEIETGRTATTGDVTFLVKAATEKKEGVNEKPVVIPEIQEWSSWTDEKLSLSMIREVRYQDDSLEAVVDEFIADYKDFTGKSLKKVKDKVAPGSISFTFGISSMFMYEEGYEMDIVEDGVIVYAETVTGNMYAAQTILQMVKQNPEELPLGKMRDYPRYEVRGLLLDIARKPISMEMIQDIARTMRYYKMNDLQLHLSDNYIFLENYGKYDTENEAFKAYEAFRLESDVTNEAGESPTAKDYYITKDEMRDFIQEQRDLGMNIVPEIDMPAHATSFTKIWPELMVENKVSPLNGNRPLVDHLDVANPEAIAKIKEIFDDYTKGENPTFDAETVVHIGADEFVDNYTAYREFVNEIVPYVKETNTVRMWGGLTWIDDGKTEIIPEAIENVEMNLWSSDWADGKQMYDMGYNLINTIDDYGYMVPSGSLTRANSYGDLLNVDRIFDSFEVSRVKTRSGYVNLPSGSDQVLGAAFAIWSDNIDKHASGLSESDLYYRFFDALPFYAEKTWAATGKEKGSADALAALAQEIGDAPNTNPYYQEDKIGEVYESYDFENGLDDTSENDRDLTAVTAVAENGALTLKGGKSYVTSPIEKLGNGNELSFDITLTKIAEPGDILFETTPAYGTHDIRIMEDGSLGFTRELYNYYFDYKLPVGKTVNIRIVAQQQDTLLYVDGNLIGEATGKYIHNDMVKKTGITHSTFAIPLERIGSETKSVSAKIDNVIIREAQVETDPYNKAGWTGTTNSETIYSTTEGLLRYAFDGNSGTIWHSNWQGATDKLTGSNSFYAEINFGKAYTINQFSFTPRTPQASGRVTKADLYIKEKASDEWKLVAENATFADDATMKTFNFAEQNVQYVKFVAKASSDGWVAVSEFDIANKPQELCTVYVEGTVAGSVSIAGAEGTMMDAVPGTEVTVIATAVNADDIFEGWFNSLGEKVSDSKEYTFILEENTALRAVFTVVSVDPVKVTEVFKDVKAGQWYVDAVQYVYDNGIMSGSGKLFKPTGNITREQVIATLYNMEGKPEVNDYTAVGALKDVKAGQWYTDAICWAYNTGVASGSNGKFNVGADVTRQQLAMMLYNYATVKGFDTTANGDYSKLEGANEVASYAVTAMKWAYGKGLLSGSKTAVNGVTVYNLNPAGNATRAQMASILKKICETND